MTGDLLDDGVELLTGPVDDPARYRVDPADLDAAISGGEGLLYRARRSATGEMVALKVLTAITVDEFPRVVDRAAVLAELDHPNLMRQIETFLGSPLGDGSTDDPSDFDVPYTVAAWIDGRPLTEVAGEADIDLKLAWIADIAAALHHLHTHRSPVAPDGVVHRDVKPSNIRVRPDGSAVLVDYGLARPVDPADMTHGAGTYLWRAPEVLSTTAPIGPAADVWALGATAHWLVTGQPPPLDGASPARERLTAGLDAADRPAAGTTARHLAELLHTQPGDRPHDLAEWSRRLARRRRPVVRAALIAALPVVLLVGALAFLPSPSTERDRPSPPPTTGRPRLVVADHLDQEDQVHDGVMIAALAYELAGTTRPVTVRLAQAEVLQGDHPCELFSECRELVGDGKRIRYVGRTGPSPLMRTADYSVSQALTLAPFSPPSAPSTARGGQRLTDVSHVRCGTSSSAIGRCAAIDLLPTPDVPGLRAAFAQLEASLSSDGHAPDERTDAQGPLRIAVVDGFGGRDTPGDPAAATCGATPTAATNSMAAGAIDEVNRAGGVLDRPIELAGATDAADVVVALGACNGGDSAAKDRAVLTQVWTSSLPEGDGIMLNGNYQPVSNPWPPFDRDDAPAGLVVFGTFSPELASPGNPDDVWKVATILQLAEDAGANRVVMDVRERKVDCPVDGANPGMLASVVGLQGVAIPALGVVCTEADEQRELRGLAPDADPQDRSIWIVDVRSPDTRVGLPQPSDRVPTLDLDRVFVIPAFNPDDGS